VDSFIDEKTLLARAAMSILHSLLLTHPGLHAVGGRSAPNNANGILMNWTKARYAGGIYAHTPAYGAAFSDRGSRHCLCGVRGVAPGEFGTRSVRNASLNNKSRTSAGTGVLAPWLTVSSIGPRYWMPVQHVAL
jgi:hypothetical protein